jgi:stage II sporulation protein D
MTQHRFKRLLHHVGLAAVVVFILSGLHGCEAPTPPKVSQKKLPGEPAIRVRIGRGVDQIRIIAPTRIQVSVLNSIQKPQILATGITLKNSNGQWLLAQGQWTATPPPANSTLVIEPLGPSSLNINSSTGRAAYPGKFHLTPSNSNPNGFDIINHVRLEAYLPGVLDRELYDHWRPAAFLAQAIVARTYAIDRMVTHGPGRHYDVESTQASQAYQGHSDNSLAVRSVADTMGLVLTHKDKIITAYYSSTCGGAGLSPLQAFGSTHDNSPALQPTTRKPWCSTSKHFDWGPITRDAGTLSRRFAAWGKANNIAIKDIGKITGVKVSQTNAQGRPFKILITDNLKQNFELMTNSFRNACNYNPKTQTIPALGSGETLKSGFFKVAFANDQVRITEGHGFGHGVGLCQYGAEGMARAGRQPEDILATYYPGAKIERAY